MARNRETKIELTAYDDLFQTDESRAEAALSKIRDIPISDIDEFPDHPFKVLMDEDMEQLVESIKRNGVMTPATVRLKDDGRYELISGHRRKKACELAGLETLKCEVKDLTRDEAIIIMVESNLQRSVILPSEKAFAYKMRLEAMNRQGQRSDLTSSPLDNKLKGTTSAQQVSKNSGDSQPQIYRFIRLTELVPEILQMVDEKQIAFRPAVEISYLAEEQQYTLLEAMSYEHNNQLNRRMNMIFADKLILLRKKVGWSQEELADQMNVTRQSVSKWEGAQSVPDLEKMLRLSELFGVSTDYLLKDEIEEAEHIDSSDDTPSLRRVSMEEANAFLSVKLRTAKTIAYAAFLCILSPIALLILSAISESTAGVLNENIANGIGMIVLIILVAIAAVMFISSGSKTAPFAYLEKEKFETEYGVSGMVKERKAQYKDLHTKNNIAGTCLCIAALIPLFIGAIINADSDLFLTIMLSLSFLIAGVGVICFIKTGVIWASYEKLLQEGEYSKENKERPSFSAAIYTAYWLIASAVYLGYSLSSNNWGQSWIIWVVAGVIFPAVIAITNAFEKKSK